MAQGLDPAVVNMIKNLEEKTGKSIDHWIGVVQSSGLAKHGELVAMLKSQHGLGHGYANMVVHVAQSSAAFSAPADDLVAAAFAGLTLLIWILIQMLLLRSATWLQLGYLAIAVGVIAEAIRQELRSTRPLAPAHP